MKNYNTVIEAVQAPVWLVADWQVEPVAEMVERTRSSDGRWLKVNCKLESPTGTFSAEKMELAEMYDTEPEMLFAARR